MLSARYISIQRIGQMVSLTLIRWIVIYPLDSAIPLLNNWGSSVKVDQESLTKKLNTFNKLIPRLKKNRERPSSINKTQRNANKKKKLV